MTSNRVIATIPIAAVAAETDYEGALRSPFVGVEVEALDHTDVEAPIVLEARSGLPPTFGTRARLSAATARQLAKALNQAADEVDPPAPSSGAFSIRPGGH